MRITVLACVCLAGAFLTSGMVRAAQGPVEDDLRYAAKIDAAMDGMRHGDSLAMQPLRGDAERALPLAVKYVADANVLVRQEVLGFARRVHSPLALGVETVLVGDADPFTARYAIEDIYNGYAPDWVRSVGGSALRANLLTHLKTVPTPRAVLLLAAFADDPGMKAWAQEYARSHAAATGTMEDWQKLAPMGIYCDVLLAACADADAADRTGAVIVGPDANLASVVLMALPAIPEGSPVLRKAVDALADTRTVRMALRGTVKVRVCDIAAEMLANRYGVDLGKDLSPQRVNRFVTVFTDAELGKVREKAAAATAK